MGDDGGQRGFEFKLKNKYYLCKENVGPTWANIFASAGGAWRPEPHLHAVARLQRTTAAHAHNITARAHDVTLDTAVTLGEGVSKYKYRLHSVNTRIQPARRALHRDFCIYLVFTGIYRCSVNTVNRIYRTGTVNTGNYKVHVRDSLYEFSTYRTEPIRLFY